MPRCCMATKVPLAIVVLALGLTPMPAGPAAAGAALLPSEANFSPVVRAGYRIGVPKPGLYREVINTDSGLYGGSNVGNAGAVMADQIAWHAFPNSISLVLPPLATLWFVAPSESTANLYESPKSLQT